MKTHARSSTSILLPILLLLAGLSIGHAQGPTSIFPPELYSGENVITVRLAAGIRSITARSTRNVTVTGGTGTFDCSTQQDIQVFVSTASERAYLILQVTDCNNKRYNDSLTLSTQWNVDRISYGEVEQGSTACREFQIRADGLATAILDSISIDDPNIVLKLPVQLPVRIPAGVTFTYRVCYKADNLGYRKFPVVTWIRREYPTAGKTNYAVADTGTVIVIPRSPDTAEPEITDPTTFRSIAVPNAIIPKQGRFFVGSYDLLGLTAGYAVTDNLMVLAAGALPLPDDWGGVNGEMFGAYSIGAKAGLPLGGGFNVAVGYQWGRSIYDKEGTDALESRITINAPYGSISYGDDDSRLSATFAYAFKRHLKPGQEFDEDAMVVAVGGDHRIGRHWKLAGEIVSVESLGVVPILATARYFTDRYALDFGLGYVGITTGDTKTPKIPLVPVISGVFVF